MMKKSLIRWAVKILLFIVMWVLSYALCTVLLIFFMFLVRNNPSFDFELGWMVFFLLTPVAAVIMSIPVAGWISGKINRRFNVQ